MSDRNRLPLATPGAVIEDHGGDIAFWLAWIIGELDGGVQTWFRRQAKQARELADDLGSIEQPVGRTFSVRAARELIASALESYNYLVASSCGQPDKAEEFSHVARHDADPSALGGSRQAPGGQPHSRCLLRPALFALLEAVEIPVPAADQVSEGSRLLTELVGWEALQHFQHLESTIGMVYRRAVEERPPALYRVLRELVPDLSNVERSRQRLSYRLYLRARLKLYCRQRGWQPAGPKYHDLNTAFAALDRRRLGEIISQIEQAPEEDWPQEVGDARRKWQQGLRLAAAEFGG
jgi:hypothetical protein